VLEPLLVEDLEDLMVLHPPVLVLHLHEVVLQEGAVEGALGVLEDELDIVQPLVQALEFDADAEEDAGLHLLIVQREGVLFEFVLCVQAVFQTCFRKCYF